VLDYVSSCAKMNSVRRHHRKADRTHSIGGVELDQRPNEAKYGAGRDDRTMGRLSHGELKPVDGESNPVRLGKPQRSQPKHLFSIQKSEPLRREKPTECWLKCFKRKCMTKAQQRANKKYRKSAKYQRNWRNGWYRRQYGISYNDFLTKIDEQKGMCPIGPHPFGPSGSVRLDSPCLDHDHKLGTNRGILCREHNRGIGAFHDSVLELKAALAYLKRFP